MIFQIYRQRTTRVVQIAPNDKGVRVEPATQYTWALEKADGEVLCRGFGWFDSEKECRSKIAEVKKAMTGARRYKVVSPDA